MHRKKHGKILNFYLSRAIVQSEVHWNRRRSSPTYGTYWIQLSDILLEELSKKWELFLCNKIMCSVFGQSENANFLNARDANYNQVWDLSIYEKIIFLISFQSVRCDTKTISLDIYESEMVLNLPQCCGVLYTVIILEQGHAVSIDETYRHQIFRMISKASFQFRKFLDEVVIYSLLRVVGY